MKVVFGLFSVIASIFAAIGWWKNIIGLIALAGAGPIGGMFALKFAGIFVFPLGVILGWMS